MYSLKGILHGITHPMRGLQEAYRVYQRDIRGNRGVRIMDEDWDALVILDACRYDLFESVNYLPGDLSAVVSGGSHTSEFLTYNFGDGEFSDTVYVSTTPQFESYDMAKRFHHSVQLWQTHWDDEYDTVLPEVAVEEALKIAREFPDKRLIVHMLQPHYPFIGENGRHMKQGSVTGDTGVLTPKHDYLTVWKQLEQGLLTREEVWAAYRENLELALPHVERLVEELTGKVVVTSDHGNSFGRWGIYGHPTKRFTRGLVVVPWLVIDRGERRRIRAGELAAPTAGRDDVDETVEARLEQLGYV